MNELVLIVRYTYTPAYYGNRDSMFVPEEPDEREEICIHEVVDEYGSDVNLSDSTMETIESHILDHIKNWLDDC